MAEDHRPGGSTPRRSAPAEAGGATGPRSSRAEHAQVLSVQADVARADGDYQRLRGAYLALLRREPTHEVALAMIGADMDRAHARLQALMGAQGLPFTHEPSAVLRREAQQAHDAPP